MSHFRKNIWMYGVILVFVSFAVLMTCFAIIASHNKENLVVKDYYKAEIEYQKQIDKMGNTKTLPSLPEINVLENEVEIFFAKEINAIDKGSIVFYRADDPDKDIVIPLEPRETGKQYIPLSVVSMGAWKVKLDWVSKGKGYYFEKPIRIP